MLSFLQIASNFIRPRSMLVIDNGKLFELTSAVIDMKKYVICHVGQKDVDLRPDVNACDRRLAAY